MITLSRFRRLEATLRGGGYGPTIVWSENIPPARDADEFADQAVYVICNSGMKVTVAESIYRRCMAALRAGESVSGVFGHPGKASAIDYIWHARERLWGVYREATDPLTSLETLPWIGKVTRYHLAKNLGADMAKPDRHLDRLARRDRTTTAKLCSKLAQETGYRAATIDTILWAACAGGLLNSQIYERDGWSAAISPEVTREAWLPPGVAETPLTEASAEFDPPAEP